MHKEGPGPPTAAETQAHMLASMRTQWELSCQARVLQGGLGCRVPDMGPLGPSEPSGTHHSCSPVLPLWMGGDGHCMGTRAWSSLGWGPALPLGGE